MADNKLIPLVAMAESGGRERDAAGNLITSPKGAQGKMQVMPAANLDPGYGVKPAADASDEERTRVGEEYLVAMVNKYGGDVNKGLAAYNAGPGRVDEAIAAYGDKFLEHLPAETQDYVAKISAQHGAQQVAQAAPRDNVDSQFLNRREESAGSAAWEELDQEYGDAEQAPAAAIEQTVEEQNDTGKPVGGAVARSVGKDVARGVTEAPGQILRGGLAAVQETLDLIHTTGNWLEKKFPITPGYNPDEHPEGIQIPQPVGEATTVTGKMFKDMSQFLVGFAGAGKLKVFKGLMPTTAAGKAAKAAGRGAVADFTVMDPHEAKLSDIIEKHPALSNPVTAFLASEANDTEATKRFKRALEGLGLGALTEGVVGGIAAMRAARKAQAEARVAAPDEVKMTVRAEELKTLGDPEGDLFIKQKAAAAAKATKGQKPGDVTGAASKEPEVFINFARINTPEDVQKVMQNMADAHAGDIKAGVRGVRTWGMTKISAAQVNAWDALVKRRVGETFNAEQSLAARQLWTVSSEKLAETAKLAAEIPSDANLVTFRKMLATHYAIQKEVLAARAETARALNAWKIPAGSDAMLTRGIEAMIEQGGGLEVNRMLAQRVAALAKAGDAQALEKLVEGSVFARSRDAVAQVWINSLLSNPTTHAVNAVSNWSVVGMQMAERRVAAMISETFGTQGGVEAGESMSMLGGMVSGFREALRSAWKTAKTGEAQFGPTKLDTQSVGGPGALSSQAWQIASDTPMGKALDVVDTVSRIPGRALATSDEFFKSIGYRMELHAQATRMATQEVREGVLKDSEFKARVANIIENPPENIQLAAVDQALYQTFTQKPAAMLAGVADHWQRLPVLGILTMPFKRTPINLLTYAAERSPMAPLVRAWREDLAAGGARADLALARVSTGSMMMLAVVDAAMSGNITGKGPTRSGERQNWMRQGNQEYSFRLGDRWYSYSRLDPVGMTIGMGADLAEAIANADKKMEQGGSSYGAMEEAMISSMFAVAKNVTSKTYMSGMAEFFDAVSDPDRNGERFVQRLAGSIVPAGVANMARQVDPYMRTAQTSLEAMQKRSPFFSDSLPMYRDLWGRPVDYRSGKGMLYDVFSPVYTKLYQPEPIDAEFQRLEYFPSMPEKKITYNGVTLDLEEYPHAYERYVELAGNEFKHPAWNLGAKDFLNAVVEGKHPMSSIYQLLSDGRDGGKAAQVQQWMNEYRRYAKDQIIQEFSDVRTEYEEKRKPYGNKYDPAIFGAE